MKTGEHPNVVAYRRTADAFRARDFDVIRSLVVEDVVWHVPGGIRWQVRSVVWMSSSPGSVGLGRLASPSASTMCSVTTSTSALELYGAQRPGVDVEIE